MSVYEKTGRYYVTGNYCRCHPETCNCNDFALIDPAGEKHSTYFNQREADEVAAAMNLAMNLTKETAPRSTEAVDPVLEFPPLKPCPFCGAGETVIQENGRIWTGMKYSDPISVSVRHWCDDDTTGPSRMIERVGRDQLQAIERWNKRVMPDLSPERVAVLIDEHAEQVPGVYVVVYESGNRGTEMHDDVLVSFVNKVRRE